MGHFVKTGHTPLYTSEGIFEVIRNTDGTLVQEPVSDLAISGYHITEPGYIKEPMDPVKFKKIKQHEDIDGMIISIRKQCPKLIK